MAARPQRTRKYCGSNVDELLIDDDAVISQKTSPHGAVITREELLQDHVSKNQAKPKLLHLNEMLRLLVDSVSIY